MRVPWEFKRYALLPIRSLSLSSPALYSLSPPFSQFLSSSSLSLYALLHCLCELALSLSLSLSGWTDGDGEGCGTQETVLMKMRKTGIANAAAQCSVSHFDNGPWRTVFFHFLNFLFLPLFVVLLFSNSSSTNKYVQVQFGTAVSVVDLCYKNYLIAQRHLFFERMESEINLWTLNC